MKERKRGKLRLCLTLIPVLALFVAIGILSGCKKSEEYRNIRITDVTGNASINRDGKQGLKVSANMNLQSGDELITEKGAKVTLRLDDDKYVVVDEDSKLLLIAEGTKEDSKTRIELEYGAVFSDIKEKLSEESDYEVITPASVMSVRGTRFEVVYRELKDDAGKIIEKVMKVLTFDGEVYVKPEGTKEMRVSKAGTMEVLQETSEGKYGFAAETKEIEAEDLSDLSANYLKEELSKDEGDLSEAEKAMKEELLEKVEQFFKGVSGKEDTTPEYKEEVFRRENHTYQFVPLEGRTWEQMNAYCEENGGHLATIMSAEENEYIYDHMVQAGFYYAYFGYTDEANEGEWSWVTGENVVYESWNASDVDNYNEEDYAMLWAYRPYLWNDGGLRESSSVAFICEWDVEKGGTVITPTPKPTTAPEATPIPEPTPEPVDTDSVLDISVFLPKVIKPLEDYEVSDMKELYEILEPHTKKINTNGIKETATLGDNVAVLLNRIATEYIEGDTAIKDAAKECFGKDVEIRCEGFYGENSGEIFTMEEDCTFAELGITSSYLTLYPVYTVYVPEDDAGYRYVPCRLMIEEYVGTMEEDCRFYTFMVQEYQDMGLPKVNGYNMFWMGAGTKSESQWEDFLEDRLNWPIIRAEKQLTE